MFHSVGQSCWTDCLFLNPISIDSLFQIPLLSWNIFRITAGSYVFSSLTVSQYHMHCTIYFDTWISCWNFIIAPSNTIFSLFHYMEHVSLIRLQGPWKQEQISPFFRVICRVWQALDEGYGLGQDSELRLDAILGLYHWPGRWCYTSR